MNKIIILLFFIFSNYLIANTYVFENFTVIASKKDSVKVNNFITKFLPKVEKFQKKIGSYNDFPITIYIAENNKEYKHFCRNYSNEIIEFSGAFYSILQKKIYVRNLNALNSTQNIPDLILHEYIHAYIHHFFKNAPLWFHEGMAVFFSSGISYQREILAIKDQFSKKPMTLTSMMITYPKTRNHWNTYYGKSALAVRFLYNNFKNNFLNLWKKKEKNQNFYKEFQSNFNMNQSYLSYRFNNYMNSYAKRSIFILISSLIPIFIPIILFINWIKRKIAYHKLNEEEDTTEINS